MITLQLKLYSWKILLDQNLFPKQSKSAIQHKPTQSHKVPQRDQLGMWQLIGSYMPGICILFPCFGIISISSFLHCFY